MSTNATMATNERMVIEVDLHAQRRGRGGLKVLIEGTEPPRVPAGRVPRVSRLMALALSIEARFLAGEIDSYADAARAGNVTRARVSQIVTLTNLAPDIIEVVLDLPRTTTGRDPIIVRDLLPIAQQLDWKLQRLMWRELRRQNGLESA